MKKTPVTLQVLKIAEGMLNYNRVEFNAILLVKGSKMTSTINTFFTPEGQVLVNISNAVTYEFEDGAEYRRWYDKVVVEKFDSDKDMYQSFTGMDDETWEEWNK